MSGTRAWKGLSHSITARLVVLLCATIVATFGAYAWLSQRSTTRQLETLARERAQSISDVILSSTRHGMLLNHKEDVHHTIRSIAASPQVSDVRIYNKDGEVIFSAVPGEVGSDVDLQAEACVSCHTGAVPLQSVSVSERSRVFQRPDGPRLLGMISPIPNALDCSSAACHAHDVEQSVLGVLDVTLSLADIDARTEASRRSAVIAAGLMALCAGCLSAVFVLRVVRRPVNSLIQGAGRVASGDLDTVIPVNGWSEIGQLAQTFNGMTHDLREARTELTEWSNRLETNLEEKTAELSRTQRQVSHMDKMASLGRLAATVAHELNNPLAGILNYSKLVDRTVVEGGELTESCREELRRYLRLIQRESERSGRIVKNLLSFARQGGGALAPAGFDEILDRALMLVAHSMQMSQVDLDHDREPYDDRLVCDPDQILQALVALLVNAVEAMPAGGLLRVRTFGTDQTVQVEIEDTGCGIPAEAQSSIFEPFYTSKDTAEGAGLGLAVVFGIVQRHGGTIEVDSDVGRGTTFRIVLPRQPGSEQVPVEHPQRPAEHPQRKERPELARTTVAKEPLT